MTNLYFFHLHAGYSIFQNFFCAGIQFFIVLNSYNIIIFYGKYRVIIETISSVNVKAETRQEAEKQIMEELSTAPNIVSKQILSVSRIRRKPQNDSAKQGKKDTIIL